MASFSTIKVQKSSISYTCETCDYSSSRQSQYNRHLETDKHLKRINSTKFNDLVQKSSHATFDCINCNKSYKERTGLWRHKKTCIHVPVINPPDITPTPAYAAENIGGYIKDKDSVIEILINENKDFKNIILDLVKSNTDLHKQMMDVCKTGIGNGTYNSHNNSHNKTFNLQFFLNEQCKDAMNIMDFVDSMTLEFSDLEDVGKLGYVEGISNIIIRKLNELDIYKRPIHCSDGKREIMYVRDDNVWGKENCTYDKLRKAIKRVSFKNSSMLVPWSKEHPQCMNTQHHLNDVYVQMIGQAMGGKEEFVDSENKIMKKIAKAVLIDK
jgi:hypothetical protein